MKEIYKKLKEEAEANAAGLRKQINRLAIARFVAFALVAVGGYSYFQNQTAGLFIVGVSLVAYVFLAKRQEERKSTHRLQEVLAKINEKELAALAGEITAFESGHKFLPQKHPYAHDLDLFGDRSLFQYINRASTQLGQRNLAKTFLDSSRGTQEIIERQEAINELKPQIKWRQQLHAFAMVQLHLDEAIHQISSWKHAEKSAKSTWAGWMAYAVPVLLAIDVFLYLVYESSVFENLLWLLVIANMLLTGAKMKAIKNELVVSAGVSKSLSQCVEMFNHIKQADFSSKKLVALQQEIGNESISAIKELSVIMSRLESVQNGFGVLFMSGTLQYHVHAFLALQDWKEKHSREAGQWFEVIGEIEALSSLAQFAYTNDHYVFPTFNNEQHLYFEEVGHPLISQDERVTNTIDFAHGRLVILTGSNMSGKSTFLRTMGINCILAKSGAPVCASAMNIDPIPLFVHMKVSDSLAGGQSYFFAEVERLRFIKEELEKGPGFVLLDEILRGTNSEDKQVGTMEFLKKLNRLNALGIVATHDLGVCDLAKEYPAQMVNKRFEVEMNGHELHFDYKLRDGICENKNASVILRQSGII
jgi:hypothetical protein